MSKVKNVSRGTVGTNDSGRWIQVRALLGGEISDIRRFADEADATMDDVKNIVDGAGGGEWSARVFWTSYGMMMELTAPIDDAAQIDEMAEKLVTAGYRRR
jgi:hypothetical protein